MSESTKRMAESTAGMEKHTGELSEGVKPMLSVEQKFENERRRVKELIQNFQDKWKHEPELLKKLKKELKEAIGQ